MRVNGYEVEPIYGKSHAIPAFIQNHLCSLGVHDKVDLKWPNSDIIVHQICGRCSWELGFQDEYFPVLKREGQ